MKKHHAAVRFSFYTAVISFLAAATIFALYFFSGDLTYALIGYLSASILCALNVIALVILRVAMSKNPAIKRMGTSATLFQLFNIPVAIVCFWAGSRLSSIARITFVNETGSTLEHVQIFGCEPYKIKNLEPGECETVWINIPNDCMISLEHYHGDTTIHENVSGYLCRGMGMVYTYNIGGKNSEPEF